MFTCRYAPGEKVYYFDLDTEKDVYVLHEDHVRYISSTAGVVYYELRSGYERSEDLLYPGKSEAKEALLEELADRFAKHKAQIMEA